MVANPLKISCLLATPSGPLQLEDESNGYTLEENTRGERQQVYRQLTEEGDWIEGTFTVASIRGNTQETLNVWVTGITHYNMEQRLETVLAGLTQLTYTLTWKVMDDQEVWNCFAIANHSIVTTKPYLFATKALLKTQVPRLPTVTRTQVTP